MDPQKIWFLYVVDHNEGPFTVDEIVNKVKSGQALQTSYVWKDPMQDWAVMENCPEFRFSKKPVLPAVSPANTITTASSGSSAAALGFKPPQGQPVKKMRSAFNFSMKKVASLLLILLVLYQMLATGMLDSVLEMADVKEKVKALVLPPIPIPTGEIKKSLRPLLIKAFNGLPADITNQLPAKFKNILMGVELPEDTPAKDVDALIEAASGSLDEGARIAVTLPKGGAEIANPGFIIASNLPDGTKLDVNLFAKETRVIGGFGFEAKTTATLKANVARSAKFNMEEKKALPKGDYMLVIYESDNQPPEVSLAVAAVPRKAVPKMIPKGKTAFTVENYFLGGKKDAEFENKLKEYNEIIALKRAAETNELGQILSTVENMANESATRFFKLTTNKKPGKKEMKAWNDYSALYLKMSAQIQALVTSKPKPSPEGIPERFFPDLYLSAASSYDLSEQLHAAEKNYFSVDFSAKSRIEDVRSLAAKTLHSLNEFREQLSQKTGGEKK